MTGSSFRFSAELLGEIISNSQTFLQANILKLSREIRSSEKLLREIKLSLVFNERRKRLESLNRLSK